MGLIAKVANLLKDENVVTQGGEMPLSGTFIQITGGGVELDEDGITPRYSVDVTLFASYSLSLEAEEDLETMLKRIVPILNDRKSGVIFTGATESQAVAFNEESETPEWLTSTISVTE